MKTARKIENDGRHRNDGRTKLPKSTNSHNSHDSHPLIPFRGDPTTLKSFQKAEVVYDFTFRFAHKFLQRGDRTIDQMIQSAGPGRKSMLEGGFPDRICGAKVCDHSRPTNTGFIVGRERLSLRNLPAAMTTGARVAYRQGQHRHLSPASNTSHHSHSSAGKIKEQAA